MIEKSFQQLVKSSRVPMFSMIGVWIAAGVVMISGIYWSVQASKGSLVAQTSEQVHQAFEVVKLESQPLKIDDYLDLQKTLQAKYIGLEAKASQDNITLEVKSAADFQIFEQALSMIAGLGGGLTKFEATEICTGENQCGGLSYRAVIKGKTWSAS